MSTNDGRTPGDEARPLDRFISRPTRNETRRDARTLFRAWQAMHDTSAAGSASFSAPASGDAPPSDPSDANRAYRQGNDGMAGEAGAAGTARTGGRSKSV